MKLETFLDDLKNLRVQIKIKNMTNWRTQFTSHGPDVAEPPMYLIAEKSNSSRHEQLP